ncbi:Fungal specific transcription factor domain [Ceratobasidium sp. AG-Ba]|nr:Fungal specific transcription factor domain [Ceratobasidium sp. AG-Ba]
MSFEEVAQRSSSGCSTCKKRKKKCDETRPVCKRCMIGNFQCSGYQDILTPNESWRHTIAVPQLLAPPYSNKPLQSHSWVDELESSTSQPQESSRGRVVTGRKKARRYLSTEPGPIIINDVYSFVLSRQTELASRTVFRPKRIPIQASVAHEASGSRLKLWALFVGAKIAQAFLDGRKEDCGVLIERFHGRVRDVSSTPSIGELELKLSCMEDLVLYASMILGSRAAYRLIEQTLPIFVRLAARYPHLWSARRMISIHQVLYRPPHYHLCKFVFYDLIAAVTFARPSLALYDTHPMSTNVPRQILETERSSALESVYGCTIPMIILFAKINALRAGVERWNQDWRQLEVEVMGWTFIADHVDDSIGRIMRLAIQESWRQAILIYLYMVSCCGRQFPAAS